MIPPSIAAYLNNRSGGPWRLDGCTGSGFHSAVVIPALAEGQNLFRTLDSLERNPAPLLADALVVVVVNHRQDADPADKQDNGETLRRLREMAPGRLHLSWVDAASPGLEWPAKQGGVGLARKTGLDLSLSRLDHTRDPILVCLDADTIVRPDYLSALTAHFTQGASQGAIVPFRHRQTESDTEQTAIDRYELFLRCYVLGLQTAGSPYGFHTVGSAMACRADAYVRIGGMNTRQAGEDFYFLQQLAKVVGVGQVAGTVVYPSPRPSHRVPFGTGRSVSRLLAGEPDAVLFYRIECYQVLQQWLALVARHPELPAASLMDQAAVIDPGLAGYLGTAAFPQTWERLQRNNKGRARLIKAFHDWFDGLKTMKLIHHLSGEQYPRESPEAAVPPVLAWAGLPPAEGLARQLEALRALQGASEP